MTSCVRRHHYHHHYHCLAAVAAAAAVVIETTSRTMCNYNGRWRRWRRDETMTTCYYSQPIISSWRFAGFAGVEHWWQQIHNTPGDPAPQTATLPKAMWRRRRACAWRPVSLVNFWSAIQKQRMNGWVVKSCYNESVELYLPSRFITDRYSLVGNQLAEADRRDVYVSDANVIKILIPKPSESDDINR